MGGAGPHQPVTVRLGGLLLAIDAATRRVTVGVSVRDGSAPTVRAASRDAGPLLGLLQEALRDARASVDDLAGVAVGTGPGSFTGLRIALATAKTLAYVRDLPLVGVATVEALAFAAASAVETRASEFAIVLPAGARDHYLGRVLVEGGDARLAGPVELVLPGADLRERVGDARAVAVDVDASTDLADGALELGTEAQAGLGQALLALGGARLAAGERDDPARLVPSYVALPRGLAGPLPELAWSVDPR